MAKKPKNLFEQAMDAEFEIGVANHGGPFISDQISADRAHILNLGDKLYNILGFRIRNNEGPMRLGEAVEQLFEIANQEPQKGHVYAAGDARANNDLWSHEFRHGKVHQEYLNDLWDAFRARSPEDWREAVLQHWGNVGGKDSGYTSLKEVEENLEHELELYSTEFIRHEANSMKDRQMAIPKEGWFRFDDGIEYSKEQYQIRKLLRKMNYGTTKKSD